MVGPIKPKQSIAFSNLTSNPLSQSAIAIFGKSNVGKSTLINRLLNKRVSRSGKRPGLTNMFNVYEAQFAHLCIDIVDCPGFGYAQNMAEKGYEDHLAKFLSKNAKNIKILFLLIDSRRVLDLTRPKKPSSVWPEKVLGQELFWIGQLALLQVATAIVMTKSDKLNTNEKQKAIQKLAVCLDVDHHDIFLVSEKDSASLTEITRFIIDYWQDF